MYHRELPAVRSLQYFQVLYPSTKLTTRSTLDKYYASIIEALFVRLQNSKTETFSLRFVRLYHFISSKDDKGLGADFFINITERIQSG